MAKITTLLDGSSSPETTSLPASPQRSRSSSTASTRGRDHLQAAVTIEADDLFERIPSTSSSRASSASAPSSRSPSPAPRSPSPAAPRAPDLAPGSEHDATPPRLSAAEKGKGRAIDAPQASEAPADVPEVERPDAAAPSKFEELVDGLNEKLVGAWHAAVAVVSYVVTTLTALWATVSEKVSTGYQAAKDGWNRAKRATSSFATAQLRRLQGYTTADVAQPTGIYSRAKAATKARIYGACAYLLNKLHGATVPAADDKKPDVGDNVDGAEKDSRPAPSDPAATAAG